ncbi:MAG: flagellar basal-body MS-ring/collar protein FliF, partial [Actinomycetota bacterium]
MASPLIQIKEIWNRLAMAGRIATIGAAVATLGLIGAMVYYGSQPDYGVLFSDLKPTDAQSIVEKLKAANVPYSLSGGGTIIQVPRDRISELRLQMAGDGAISGGHVGFDLFDKTNFGATDFAQQVNYRRAIEGELSKTLEGMDEVESVRVHITPQKESVFTEKEEGAKASVMLRVKQGKELS